MFWSRVWQKLYMSKKKFRKKNVTVRSTQFGLIFFKWHGNRTAKTILPAPRRKSMASTTPHSANLVVHLADCVSAIVRMYFRINGASVYKFFLWWYSWFQRVYRKMSLSHMSELWGIRSRNTGLQKTDFGRLPRMLYYITGQICRFWDHAIQSCFMVFAAVCLFSIVLNRKRPNTGLRRVITYLPTHPLLPNLSTTFISF